MVAGLPLFGQALGQAELQEIRGSFVKDEQTAALQNVISHTLDLSKLAIRVNPDKVLDVISPEKDVDGFHPRNVASLHLGRPCTFPCTPKGIIRLIDSTGTVIDGKRAVVIGRSNIVGKPVAKLLQDRNATVTVAHSHTPDLAALTREADILVVATGHAGLVDGTMIKPGAVVIDVGITRRGKRIIGDVDFASASQVASYITPVPGGVGPMTVAMLMENTIECFEARMQQIS